MEHSGIMFDLRRNQDVLQIISLYCMNIIISYFIPELPSNLNVWMVVVTGFTATSPIKDGKPLFWMYVIFCKERQILEDSIGPK